ncbi:MAG: hypothetical protein R3277_05070 [Brumimicrobium sp.]|nr:hypothetical protein [Brumimicrobium sp.]
MLSQSENIDLVLIEDFSKDYNPFRWIYTVLFFAFGSISLLVFLIFFFKMLGYSNDDLSWMPFDAEKFPFSGQIIEYIGTGIILILTIFFFGMSAYYFFRGKVTKVYLDEKRNNLILVRNGLFKKRKEISVDDIKYLRKKKNKRGPNSISTGQHRVYTINLQFLRAYAVLKGTNKYVFLFDFYDQKRFNKAFKELSAFVKKQ